jgi:CheY-like chemotaxis protein
MQDFSDQESAFRPAGEARSAATPPQPSPPGAAAANVVLVVDDDPLCLEILTRTLARAGYQPVAVPSGDEALRLARSLRPAAILLDVVMPGMTGWDVLNTLKAEPNLKTIPVIMVTTLDERNKGRALGVSEYLLKPIDRGRLPTLLKKHGVLAGA